MSYGSQPVSQLISFCINTNQFCTGKIPKHKWKQDRSSRAASLFILLLLGVRRRGRSGACRYGEASSPSTAQALPPLPSAQPFCIQTAFDVCTEQSAVCFRWKRLNFMKNLHFLLPKPLCPLIATALQCLKTHYIFKCFCRARGYHISSISEKKKEIMF